MPERPRGRVGLYDPSYEHDACGVAFVAKLDGTPSHETVERAIVALENLEHRGAAGADPNTGDGAGMLLQLPDEFLRGVLDEDLPPSGAYGVCVCFLPRERARRETLERLLEQTVRAEGQRVVGWRDVPVDKDYVGITANLYAPYVKHLVVAASDELAADQDAFERKLYVIRRVAEIAAGPDLVVPSFSSRTIVYKGMLTSPQLLGYYPDLADPRTKTALALVHSRFSTNTFPSWELAHPYRMIAHNGEINTLRGNVNWMRARESQLASELFGDDLPKVLPVVRPAGSDSATFDNVLELLVLAGRSLPHAVMMMIPEAYENRDDLPEDLKGFYAFHSCLMEPWDGPAAVAFTDGQVIGATLDRNGLRPGRWLETKDGWVVLGSETGVMDEAPENVKRKGRLQPGKLFLVDIARGRIVDDGEVKREVAGAQPYGEWFERGIVHLGDLPDGPEHPAPAEPLHARQRAFGYTQEDLRVLLAPTAAKAEEPIGSMGNDAALAVLSDRQPPLFNYFKQLFAQVTNPPIDPIREAIVMSVGTGVGSERNLLAETPEHAHQLSMQTPILFDRELQKLRHVDSSVFAARTLDTTWPVAEGPEGMVRALERVCAEADAALADGVNILILSDRAVSRERAGIPALLAVAGVHHHLVREGTRLQTGLVLESGEPREVHHFATLIGYGASAINPYLMWETLAELVRDGRVPGVDDYGTAEWNVVKGIAKGLLKTISKMGISTIQSYNGAQIFEAVGLAESLVERHFTGTASRIGGIDAEVLAIETLERHARGFGVALDDLLPVGGIYAWRREGEHHMWNPETIALLQHSVRHGGQPTYDEYAKLVNEDAARRATLRGLLAFRELPESDWLPLEEIEPASEIVKRFVTGAMSLGSLSREAHETLAIAMNRLGGKSNTGEGGEDPVRYKPDPNGDLRRSAIKQVASGRFGVTAEYLVNSDMMQIKMAQGAKPGEGGQLPGHKVDKTIAKVRHSTPGVGLISPPPHHDIYSIEDLAQLIFDLKNVNPAGDVSVKLVSEVGVGTVAAGVSKARADHVTISGFEGGTGASPLTSLKHAGSPWEIGLAETHQTLVANRLRSRIAVQVDGGIRTGRDVVVGALLGADEFGFATAPLIAAGCIMMRKCHLNTCPVGVATQDPILRKRFVGQPEHVINYFFFVAEEVRAIMASLGFRTFDEMIGQMQMLDRRKVVAHAKSQGLDFSKLFTKPNAPKGVGIYRSEPQDHKIAKILDRKLIAEAQAALDRGAPVKLTAAIKNIDRTAGAMLSGEVAKRYGHAGLPDDTIHVMLKGIAGQSFGAFLARGVTFELDGEGNDYVGKGLSGGKVIIRPPAESGIVPEESIIVGNTVLYGAVEGEAYFRGIAGERFAVRNSGAIVVVEGTGDHGCEYMTGGVVAVLGRTGRNFAAGMSGGIAYVLDEDGSFKSRCNLAMVELEPLPAEEEVSEKTYHQLRDLTAHGRVEVMNDMTSRDARRLHWMISQHARHTGSKRAREILADWAAYLPKFKKVMPTEYRRALREIKAQEEAEMPRLAAGA